MRHLLAVLFAATFFVSCSTVPMTNRQQLKLVPSQQMMALSVEQYNGMLGEAKVVNSGKQLAQIQRVGRRITAAVAEYYQEHGLKNNFAWEFALIDEPQVNAWCMPGGKIAFYTGIMPICHDDAGVAAVMGHEIAHAMAEHSNERFSQSLLTQFGMAAMNEAMKSKPEETRQLWSTAVGVGAQVGVILPFSRLHESEADEIGLILMARAGYDPAEAVHFWERMRDAGNGKQPPEFLSTHPSHDRRISEIRKLLPQARQYYKPEAAP